MNMFVRSTRNYKEWTINIHILRTKVGPDYFFSLELKGRDHFLYCILRSDQKYFETSVGGQFVILRINILELQKADHFKIILRTKMGPEIFWNCKGRIMSYTAYFKIGLDFFLELQRRDHFLYCVLSWDMKYLGTSEGGLFLILRTKVGQEIFRNFRGRTISYTAH